MVFAASTLVADTYLGQNITLSCMAEGVPAPNVTWGKANGKPLPGDGRSFQVKTEPTSTRAVSFCAVFIFFSQWDSDGILL